MAEGIQKKIEYADLQFISAFAMGKILDFQTWEIPGEHARGNFRLLLSENETGINGMNEPIQLCGHGNTAGALFCGYPEGGNQRRRQIQDCRCTGCIWNNSVRPEKMQPGISEKSTDLYGDCQYRNSRHRAQRLYIAGQ